MITVYGGNNCSACEGVKSALEADKIPYTYVDVFDPEIAQEHKDTFFGEHNFRTIPQLFEGREYLGNASVISAVIKYRRGEAEDE
jgi:glutaredoxin